MIASIPMPKAAVPSRADAEPPSDLASAINTAVKTPYMTGRTQKKILSVITVPHLADNR
jgi:hypothetical protein